ncbi:MAG TPA: hypothetical protein VGP79_12675, partial [Bryobacteraceae bacterium]|nr:hypothetical protein [Bryobacteraceae bacterium]
MLPLILLTGLSMSIGWGVRGQFGHEYGAALAGALGGMVVALLSGRADWVRRVHYFAMFGAIGWAFGGSMSYMKNLAFTQSSDSATVLYGFASLFLIGFAWAAPGGAGVAIAARLDREELTKFFEPLCAVLAAWYLQDVFHGPLRALRGTVLVETELSAALAIVAVLLLALVRRKSWGIGSALILHMAVGWWLGFLLFNVILKWHLNPPREDGWGAMLGMIAGILIFCARKGLKEVAFATIATGLMGGVAFSLGQGIRLLAMASGLKTNWHSVMEQTQGLLFGVALAVALGLIARRAAKLGDDPPVRRWTEVFSVTFVMIVLTYLNFRKSPNDWVKQIATLTPEMYGIRISGNLVPSGGFVGWFDMIYLGLAAVTIGLLVLHLRRRVPFIPESWMGKGQLMYLAFLWAVVGINFVHVLPRFTPQRLVTEWVMTVNAMLCTVLVVIGSVSARVRDDSPV